VLDRDAPWRRARSNANEAWIGSRRWSPRRRARRGARGTARRWLTVSAELAAVW